MVMVSPALNPTACWEFEGEILVLHHPTTISSRYQAMGVFFLINLYLTSLQCQNEVHPALLFGITKLLKLV